MFLARVVQSAVSTPSNEMKWIQEMLTKALTSYRVNQVGKFGQPNWANLAGQIRSNSNLDGQIVQIRKIGQVGTFGQIGNLAGQIQSDLGIK